MGQIVPAEGTEFEYTPPNHGKSIAEKIWDRLDEIVKEINTARRANSSCVLATVRAEELAWVLVLMCQPYYADTKAVSIEAAKRAKMDEGSIAWQPTPGYRYNPPPAGSNVVTVTPTKVVVRIPAAKRKDITAAIKMGLPMDSLAGAFGVTVDQLVELKKEIDSA